MPTTRHQSRLQDRLQDRLQGLLQGLLLGLLPALALLLAPTALVAERAGATSACSTDAQQDAGQQDAGQQDSGQQDAGDETPRRAVGVHFEVQATWFSQRDPAGAVGAALELAEAVALAARGAGLALPGTPEDGGAAPARIVLGLAESPRALRELATDGPELPLVARVPAYAAAGGPPESFVAVSISPVFDDRVLFLTGMPPATVRAIAGEAARALLESAPTAADLAPVAREGLRAEIADAALVSLGRSAGLAGDPALGAGVRALRAELEGVAAPEERAAALLARATAWATSATDGIGAAFDVDVAAAVPAGSIACRLLHRASGDPAAALAALDALEPEWHLESGGVAPVVDQWKAVGTRQSDALALLTVAQPARATVRAEVWAVGNSPRFAAQADIAVGDVDGDRFLLVLNSSRGLYLFRRRGPAAPYEPIAERRDVKVAQAEWIPVEIALLGDAIQVRLDGQLALSARVEDRTTAGSVGLGCHAGSTAFYRGFWVETPAAEDGR